MAIQRVRALKIETLAEGGGQDDTSFGQTEVSVGSDYLDSQGSTYQRPSANTATSDSKVYVTRSSTDDLTFVDPNFGLAALQQLVTTITGRISSHNAIGGLEHWALGPNDAFTSGASLVVTQSGILPSAFTWFASNASSANKLFQVSITYSGIRPATITQRLYSAGALVRTYVDTLTYNNVFYPTVTRTWS